MRLENVDVDFHGNVTPSAAEQGDWQRIVANALSRHDGSVLVTLRGSGDTWRLETVLWYQPGAWFLKAASAAETEPLRTAIIAALRTAGKRFDV